MMNAGKHWMVALKIPFPAIRLEMGGDISNVIVEVIYAGNELLAH